jgi:hypothetical protein
MKKSLFFRFIPERLLRARLFRRDPTAKPSPLPLEHPGERRGRMRYVSMQIGSQILPFIIDTGGPDRRRDPYE